MMAPRRRRGLAALLLLAGALVACARPWPASRRVLLYSYGACGHEWRVAASGDKPLWHSRDGGKTWRPANLEAPPRPRSARLVWLDAQHGWLSLAYDSPAGGRGILLHTADGGRRWAAIRRGRSRLHVLAFRDLLRGYAVDWSAKSLLVTIDGGRRWRPLTLPRAGDLGRFVGGRFGPRSLIFLRTRDGRSLVGYLTDDWGLTWERTEPVPAGSLVIPGPRRAYVWTRGTATGWTTQDGGRTWRPTSRH